MTLGAMEFATVLVLTLLMGLSCQSLEISPACTQNNVTTKRFHRSGLDVLLLQPTFKAQLQDRQKAKFEITLNRSCLVRILGVQFRYHGACVVEVRIGLKDLGSSNQLRFTPNTPSAAYVIGGAYFNKTTIVCTSSYPRLLFRWKQAKADNSPTCMVDTDAFQQNHSTGIIAIDVDECPENQNVCNTLTHQCINTFGSYRCSAISTSSEGVTEETGYAPTPSPPPPPPKKSPLEFTCPSSPTTKSHERVTASAAPDQTSSSATTKSSNPPQPLSTSQSPEGVTGNTGDPGHPSTKQPSSSSSRPSPASKPPDKVFPIVAPILLTMIAIVLIFIIWKVKNDRQGIRSDFIVLCTLCRKLKRGGRPEEERRQPSGPAENSQAEYAYVAARPCAALGAVQDQEQGQSNDYLTPIELLPTGAMSDRHVTPDPDSKQQGGNSIALAPSTVQHPASPANVDPTSYSVAAFTTDGVYFAVGQKNRADNTTDSNVSLSSARGNGELQPTPSTGKQHLTDQAATKSAALYTIPAKAGRKDAVLKPPVSGEERYACVSPVLRQIDLPPDKPASYRLHK